MSFTQFPKRSITFLVAALLACSGCRPLQVAGGIRDDAPSDPQWVETLDALASRLEHDVWRPNPHWSPQKQWETRDGDRAPANQSRWLFGSKPVDEMLDQLESEPRRAGDANPRAVSARQLRELARRDDLAGWNAAILLARRDPAHGIDVAKVLERLVTKPPQYDSDTKQAVTGANRSKPATTSTKTTNESNGLISLFWPQSALEKPGAEEKADKSMGSSTSVPPPPQSPLLKGGSKNREGGSFGAMRISMSMRSAAAEVWCFVLAYSSPDPVEALAPVGRLLLRNDFPEPIRGELFRGVARWIAPNQIPGLEFSLRKRDPTRKLVATPDRIAAGEACLINALWRQTGENSDSTGPQNSPITFDESIWPATIHNCKLDRNPQVRRTYSRWLAVVQHPDAFRILKSQLRDTDFRVRDDALIHLGLVGTAAAKLELKKQSRRSEEQIRAMVVKGLIRWGVAEVAPFVDDRSFLVRQSVAEELARSPSVEAALLLRDLLTDVNSQVQLEAVRSVDDWPDRLALPLLLHGMQAGSLLTCQSCFIRLKARTGLRTNFPVEAPLAQRAEAVVRLAREAHLPLGSLDQLRQEGFHSTRNLDVPRVAEINSLLRDVTHSLPQSPVYQAAMQRLEQASVLDVPLIEQFLLQAPQDRTGILYRELLPKLSPRYAALHKLESGDVFVRRLGARELVELAARASLSQLAVRTLWQRLVHEQNQLVWRYAMSAIQREGTDESAQVALLAINSDWPDIRTLGCEYFGRHGRWEHAALLSPLLDDANKSVQLAAIRAAGRCHNPIVVGGTEGQGLNGRPPGLQTLLTDSDRRVRFAAAVSMSRLGHPLGLQELERMSLHQNVKIRDEVVRQMGQTGQSRFVESLIRLAWTESNNTVKRSILESLDLLTTPEQRPAELSRVSGYDAKIEKWVTWWEQRRRGRLEPAHL